MSAEQLIQDTSDPKKVGPGKWDHMHRTALKAQDSDTRAFFNKTVREICDGMACSYCKKHCKDYIIKFPPEKAEVKIINYAGKRIDIGPFEWTVTKHNTVNHRLGKPMISVAKALEIYMQGEVCTEVCAANGSNEVHSQEESVSTAMKISNAPISIPTGLDRIVFNNYIPGNGPLVPTYSSRRSKIHLSPRLQ